MKVCDGSNSLWQCMNVSMLRAHEWERTHLLEVLISTVSCSIPHRTQRSNPVHPLIDYSAISIYNVDSTYDVLLAPSPEISIPIHPATSMRQPSQTAFFLGLVLSSSNQVEGIWFCIGVNLVCVFVASPYFDRLCSKQKRETYPLITILMPSRLLGWWRI